MILQLRSVICIFRAFKFEEAKLSVKENSAEDLISLLKDLPVTETFAVDFTSLPKVISN